MLKLYLKELRLKNWLKNIFVMLPALFSLEFLQTDKMIGVITALLAFCLISSAVYVGNDLTDATKDAEHPVKCLRPIASGAVTRKRAVLLMGTLTFLGCAIGFAVNIPTGIYIVVYLGINLFYTLWLKNRPLFDCFCIAAGFVLRVYTGSAACGAPVSDWLFLTVVTMSLFMAFGKRRGELLSTGTFRTRTVLSFYSIDFLNGMVFMFAGLTVVFYALWAMNRGSRMIYTVPFIGFIIAKYLLRLHDQDVSDDPSTMIWGDKLLLFSCALYGLLTALLLYLAGKT